VISGASGMPWEAFTIEQFEQLGQSLAEVAAVVFFLVVGGNIGSFLNVVAHRIPLGMSVVFGGSRCPACGQAIRPRDNLPVLGWLLLRGRCRDCLVPIPVRYPLVEAVAAVLIGSVASVEILSGGYTLPLGNQVTQGRWWRGVDELLFQPNGRLFAICLLHVAGMATLLAWALLEYDRQRVPRRWSSVVGLMLPVLSLLWPWLQPVVAFPAAVLNGPFGSLSLGQAAGLSCLIGLLAGWLLGSLFRGIGFAGPFVVVGLALIGGLCGWQAVITVSLIGLLCSWVRRRGASFCRPASGLSVSLSYRLTTADLLVAFTLQLLSWRWLAAGTERQVSEVITTLCS
jgi:leader peptidase (prepilin peptidase)/N-methyltransferase